MGGGLNLRNNLILGMSQLIQGVNYSVELNHPEKLTPGKEYPWP